MIDLRKRQEEFKRNLLFKVGKVPSEIFDAFRESPEYLAMKEALEFYALETSHRGTEVYVCSYGEANVIDVGDVAREVLAAIEGV